MALSINQKSRLNEDDPDYKSKTQVKEELDALKKLGETLTIIPDKLYQSLDIPEKLDEAIQTLKRIKSNIAKKRQFQYIGKLMRDMDIDHIETTIHEWEYGRKNLSRELKKLEQLRDRLIANDPEALQQIIAEHPDCDIQKLRQLIRTTQKEIKLKKPPTNFRLLLKLLKELHIKV